MPYKDKTKYQEYNRKRMRVARGGTSVQPKPDSSVQPVVQLTGEITVDVKKAAKLLMICNSLNKQIGGLNGKENMLDLVRYGVNGPTMRVVMEKLS